MLQRKPRAEGSFDAGRSSIARWKTSVRSINLRLLHWHGQSTQRSRLGIGCRYLEFRLSNHFRLVQILAPFLLVGDIVSMVNPGTPDRSTVTQHPLRISTGSLSRALGRAEACRRDYVFDLEARRFIASHGLYWPPRGQASQRSAA